MPKIIKPLVEQKIKNIKPRDKNFKLYDGEGLCLVIYNYWFKKLSAPKYNIPIKTNHLI